MNKYFKNTNMYERNNDTFYLDLIDYLEGFNPDIITKGKVEEFLNDFKISEEGDTTISGTQREWVLFLVLILERYSL